MTVLKFPIDVPGTPLRGMLRLKVNLDRLKAFENRLRDRKNFFNLANDWAAAYFAFSQRRFQRYSKGVGDWAKLSKRARRTKRWARWNRHAILADSLTLYNALAPHKNITVPGQIRRIENPGTVSRPGRLTIGIGGQDRHPRKSNDGNLRSIGQIATIHQFGLKNARTKKLPKRRILVQPPRELVEKDIKDITIRWARNLAGTRV